MKRMKLRNKIFIDNKIIIIVIIFIIFLNVFFLIKSFSNKSRLFLLDFAESESIELSTILINKSIYEILNNVRNEDIVKIIRNEDNEILDVSYNTNILNNIIYLVSDNILKNISNIEKCKLNDLNLKYYNIDDLIYYIPFGIIYNKAILTDIGPKIPYKVSFIGSVDTHINTNVKSYGINNSLIENFLNINLNIMVIFPFASKNVNINKNILLSSNIINGKIPSYYGGIITNSSPIISN